MIRILIADDHFLVRAGLRQLLEENLPHIGVDEADDAASALSRAAAADYDLVMLDFSMPGRDGLDLLRDLIDLNPRTHVIILSIMPEDQYALRAFKLGASGCLNKSMDPAELLDAVRTVLSGRRFLSKRSQELLLGDMTGDPAAEPHTRLSDREFQVLRLLASGKSVGEIAALCSLSAKTVSTYRGRVLEKMNMENNAQLMNYAFRHGLVDAT